MSNVILDALIKERDNLREKIINLSGRQELETNERARKMMGDELRETREKLDELSESIAKYSNE